ncbi:ribonuclease H-like domain-containing protein [Tanacetum coccineum]
MNSLNVSLTFLSIYLRLVAVDGSDETKRGYQGRCSLVAYTDVDWVGCPTTRRSTSGYYVFLGDNILSWSAKRQHTLSRPSDEAEYIGVANVLAETGWLPNLLR